MTGDDSTDSARDVNTIPLINPDGLYTAKQVVAIFGIHRDTLTFWTKDGLKTCKPKAKQFYYFGRHIIDYMVSKAE